MNLDFIKCGAKCALLYNYCKPTINNKYDNKSYFESNKMRHPIIEIIQEDDKNRLNISLSVKVTENGANTNIIILVSEQGNISIV